MFTEIYDLDSRIINNPNNPLHIQNVKLQKVQKIILTISNKTNKNYLIIAILLQNKIVTSRKGCLKKFLRVIAHQNMFVTS